MRRVGFSLLVLTATACGTALADAVPRAYGQGPVDRCSAAAPRALSCRPGASQVRQVRYATHRSAPSQPVIRKRRLYAPGSAHLTQVAGRIPSRPEELLFESWTVLRRCRWLPACTAGAAAAPGDPLVDALLGIPSPSTRRTLDVLGIPAVPGVPPIVIINQDDRHPR